MRVAVFQSEAHETAPTERIKKLENALKQQQTDLLVCPELYTSGYNMGELLKSRAEPQKGDTAKHITKLAKRYNTAILYGYPELANDKIYNSAHCINKNGKPLANHRKLLLPPGFESDYFDSGDSMSYFSINGIKFCILICYDAEFPESVRAAAQAGAHAIIVPTALSDNWGVVADKIMPTRAFENGVWMIYANHSGIEDKLCYYGGSCIVKPDGIDAARAESEETVIYAEIEIESVKSAQERLPYLQKVHQWNKIVGDN
jgi:predicted amidohydrolase